MAVKQILEILEYLLHDNIALRNKDFSHLQIIPGYVNISKYTKCLVTRHNKNKLSDVSFISMYCTRFSNNITSLPSIKLKLSWDIKKRQRQEKNILCT